jgi:tetratricopeptide (TPR) repeat protein
VTLDPKFKRVVEGEKKLSFEEERALKDDLFSFAAEMNRVDQRLRSVEEKENKQIFGNGGGQGTFQKSQAVEELERKKTAEDERLKGNEFMKTKEFSEAVACYSKSIEIDPEQPFTFANRAMAFLKLKEYKRAIEDADVALRLKPGYLKAVHRRGKAYLALN